MFHQSDRLRCCHALSGAEPYGQVKLDANGDDRGSGKKAPLESGLTDRPAR